MKVLLTRPAGMAAATAERLAGLGHEVVLAPCLRIVPRQAALPAAPAAIILTSGNAVPALPSHYAGIQVFCVGDATAARLRQAGFKRVESAGGDAEDLFRLVTARRMAGEHLLAVQAGQGLELAARLNGAGIAVRRREVYEAEAVAALPAAVLAALAQGDVDAALFYSAETALAFCRLAPAGTGAVAACALSPRVAAALGGLPWRAIHVALAPNEADLMALLHE